MFHSARLTLTAWYLAIIMTVSLAFSFVIYHGLSQEVDRFARAQRSFIQRKMQENLFYQPGEVYFINPDLVSETKHRIIFLLATINGAILILAGGLGYMLAGRTLQPIADMVEQQHRFVSDASHELKTPLTSLKSAFEVYLRNKKRTKSEADALVTESIVEVNKLQSLSESLLSLAHHATSGTDTSEPFSLSQSIAEAVKKIKPIATKKHVTIAQDISDATVYGVKQNITELFVILLDNAVKYSDEKTSIMLRAHVTDRWVNVTVDDEGIGVQKNNIPHIFDRFFQEDSARSKTRGGGYGLGLSIAKKITVAHGGTIQAKRRSPKGMTFIVRLPIFSVASDSLV